MQDFWYFELFLYVFPLIELVVIQKYFRSYLTYKQSIKLTTAEVVLPFLAAGIHILSVWAFGFSLLPYLLFGAAVIGTGSVAYFQYRQKEISLRPFRLFYSKTVFSLTICCYYVLVGIRIYQFIRG